MSSRSSWSSVNLAEQSENAKPIVSFQELKGVIGVAGIQEQAQSDCSRREL